MSFERRTPPAFSGPMGRRGGMKLAAYGIALGFAGGVFAGCRAHGGGASKADKADEGKDEAVPVELARLDHGPIEAVLRFSTNLEAERSVRVLARAAGQVTELRVEEGDEVKRGQVLARLQQDEQASRLARARAELAMTENEHDKLTALRAEGAVSAQEFERLSYDLKRLRLLKNDAERDLRYTVIRAPIPGMVTERLIKLGDTVSASQHAFDIVDFDSIVARIFVPEKELAHIKPGLQARIQAQALPSGYRGSVARIAPVVDPRTGTVKVTVAIPRDPSLRPGMFAELELVTAVHQRALLLPKRALVYDDDVAYAFKLGPDSRAHRVQVHTVLENHTYVEPRRDFARGDQVIIAGQAGLKHGALVKSVAKQDSAKARAAVHTDQGSTRKN